MVSYFVGFHFHFPQEHFGFLQAVQQKKVRCQLAGLVMGDSWISPVDAVASWGPYLYATVGSMQVTHTSVDARKGLFVYFFSLSPAGLHRG